MLSTSRDAAERVGGKGTIVGYSEGASKRTDSKGTCHEWSVRAPETEPLARIPLTEQKVRSSLMEWLVRTPVTDQMTGVPAGEAEE